LALLILLGAALLGAKIWLDFFRKRKAKPSRLHSLIMKSRSRRLVFAFVAPLLMVGAGYLAVPAYGSQVGDATFQGSIFFAVLVFVVLIFAAFKDN